MARFPVTAAAAIGLAFLPALAAGRAADRCGPADDPSKWPDYGGTPDALVSAELGLGVEEIEVLLRGLEAGTAEERRAAAEELARNAPGSEQSLRQVLWSDHGARNIEMKNAVQVARGRLDRARGASAGSGKLLHGLLELPPGDGEQGRGVRGTTRVVAMLEALLGLNTMAGYKVLLDFSGRHAGVFRQEIGRMLVEDAGFDALPALVYGRGSPDKELHMFAVKWIRDLGNPLLGEQVRQIRNPRRLAQLLEAYASVNDLGAVDVTLALANHESAFVRCAARASLERYGVNAKWSLRRQYENTFSREPRPGTDFETWREELFAHYDSVRIAPAMALFEQGLEAAGRGDFRRMSECFGGVLRDFPVFPRRHEMAAGFLDHAAALERDGDPAGARGAAMLALRVSAQGSEAARRAEARLDWARVEEMRAAGVLDLEVYRAMREFAPDPAAAAKRTEEGEAGSAGEGRLTGAVAVSLALFAGGLLVLLRLRLLGMARRRRIGS
jgi:hypothetical protein